MIPAAILEAESHRLTEGAAMGTPLQDLPDDKLAAVVKHYDKTRNFYEWRAAYLTACSRVLRAFGLFDVRRQTLADIAAQGGEIGTAARWYLEWFGMELQ